MKPTYVLFVPGTIGPSVYHDSLASARLEARRIIETGAQKVMICRFTEGLERVTSTITLTENPLKKSPRPTKIPA